MKKLLMIFMALSLSVGAISGCSNNKNNDNSSTVTQKDGVFINEKYSATGMKTIGGNDFSPETDKTAIAEPSFGFGIKHPDEIYSLIESQKMGGYAIEPYSLGLGYFISESDVFYLSGVWRYEKNAPGMDENLEMWKALYTNVEVITETDDNIYYWGYNNDISALTLTDEQKKDIETVIGLLDELKNNVCIFTPEIVDVTEVQGDLSSFEAKDIEGNTVTQDIFANYDITMVNIWATWCGPCLAELPEIGELYNELPEKTNIISICTDGASETDFAKEILKESGCDFTTIIPSADMEDNFLRNISSIPYTIFVNSKGEIVGKAQVGAPAPEGQIKDAYKDIIMERLESLNGGQSE